MTITVIMPVYNDQLAERAIKSVMEQKFQDWQLKILDNGSTDAHVVSMLKKYDGMQGIEVIRYEQNRQSECGALYGMDVKTPYMAYLFSDDQWHPEFLNRMMKAMINSYTPFGQPYSAAFCNTAYVDEDGATWRKVPDTQFDGDITDMNNDKHLYHMFTSKNTLHPSAMVISSAVYRRLGGFDPWLHRVGDMRFFAKLLGVYDDVVFVKEKLSYITCNSVISGRRNSSHDNDKASLSMMAERQQFLEVYSSKEVRSLLPRIFAFPDTGNDALNLYFLGTLSIKNPAADYVLFGWRCIYRALELDYNAVNGWVMQQHHTSVGEFIKKLQRRD